jgi:hypothetical protein
MAADDAAAAAEAVATAAKPRQTLSEFVARVLDQLSLSAWLPSAALVLLLDFIAQLGIALGAKRTGATAAIGNALSRMSAVGIGGAVLLVIAIVVLAILTQAFSFEAIRVLEGYWGTARPVEVIARHRVTRHRRRQQQLSARRRELTGQAWDVAKSKIVGIEDERRQNGQRPAMTAAMIAHLEARVLGQFPSGRLTPGQRERGTQL